LIETILFFTILGARIPRSGSAYTYIYITIGEFVAFIIGWDVLMEYMIGKEIY
jgi:amino acid transporter